MSSNKRLIVVIDMLNGFCFQGPLSDKRIAQIIPQIKNLLLQGDDNLFLCDSHSLNDPEMTIYPPHCLSGTYEAEVVDELKNLIKRKITKQTTYIRINKLDT
ncbi:isochorismatase family protein [Mycoplasmopsis gallopavonis]|uniref:Amidase from nicotinamidase family n=1 Tax=Mycoplasmopsis gallopavonis TaxID=76629 RepID=A0A449AZC4_9BACT|nr:isochorismatase family protein [Mycoplasmopsis gallopavonis]RIV16809.1 isochorismatase family protein [Mycoplasmopsis gallopavonis]VEU72825.1 amidase from nicotinamidase family [Mycoplasmopsis gallopavonis]